MGEGVHGKGWKWGAGGLQPLMHKRAMVHKRATACKCATGHECATACKCTAAQIFSHTE